MSSVEQGLGAWKPNITKESKTYEQDLLNNIGLLLTLKARSLYGMNLKHLRYASLAIGGEVQSQIIVGDFEPYVRVAEQAGRKMTVAIASDVADMIVVQATPVRTGMQQLDNAFQYAEILSLT